MTASAAVIAVLNEQVKKMEAKVELLFRRHPDAGTYLSQPGIGVITGARMLGEFGDARLLFLIGQVRAFLERESNVFHHSEGIKQGARLKNHGDALPDFGELRFGPLCYVLPGHQHAA